MNGENATALVAAAREATRDGQYAWSRGELTVAFRSFRTAFETALQAENEQLQSVTGHNLALLLYRAGLTEEALAVESELFSRFYTLSTSLKIGVLKLLAAIASKMGRQELLESYYEELVRLCEAAGNWGDAGWLHVKLFGYNQQRYSSHLHSALECYSRAGDTQRLVKLRACKAVLLHRTGRKNEAVGLLHETVKVINTLSARELVSASNELGIAFFQCDNYSRAISEFERALVLATGAGTVAQQASLLQNLAVVYCALSNYSDAVGLLHKAVDHHAKAGQKRARMHSLQNLGFAAASSHDLVGSVVANQEALRFAVALSDEKAQCEIAESLGAVFLQQQQVACAQKFLEMALRLSHDSRGDMTPTSHRLCQKLQQLSFAKQMNGQSVTSSLDNSAPRGRADSDCSQLTASSTPDSTLNRLTDALRANLDSPASSFSPTATASPSSMMKSSVMALAQVAKGIKGTEAVRSSATLDEIKAEHNVTWEKLAGNLSEPEDEETDESSSSCSSSDEESGDVAEESAAGPEREPAATLEGESAAAGPVNDDVAVETDDEQRLGRAVPRKQLGERSQSTTALSWQKMVRQTREEVGAEEDPAEVKQSSQACVIS